MSWHAAGAALAQQLPELESSKGETAGPLPPAIDRPMARAVSLVARRDRSAVLCSSLMSSALNPSPSSSSMSRSAWYACSTATCRHEPAWPAATYPLSTGAEGGAVVWRAKSEPSETTQRQGTDREHLFHQRHCSVTALTRPRHITVVIGRGDEEAGRKWFCPWSRNLGVEIRGKMACSDVEVVF